MNELGRLSGFGGGEGCLASHVIDVEIPIIQQLLSVPTTQALAVVGLQLQLSIAPDVVQVFADGLEVVARTWEYLNDRLRRPPDSPLDLLQLRRRQSAARLAWPASAIANDVQ
jgi:hypothetical protein